MKKIITLVLSLLLFSALIVTAYAIDTGPQTVSYTHLRAHETGPPRV